jgi:hypothetical protein
MIRNNNSICDVADETASTRSRGDGVELGEGNPLYVAPNVVRGGCLNRLRKVTGNAFLPRPKVSTVHVQIEGFIDQGLEDELPCKADQGKRPKRNTSGVDMLGDLIEKL